MGTDLCHQHVTCHQLRPHLIRCQRAVLAFSYVSADFVAVAAIADDKPYAVAELAAEVEHMMQSQLGLLELPASL